MGDHALQLVAVERVDRAAGDADHGILRRGAGGKGVDGRLVIEQEDRRHRRARGDGHLFDDVQQHAFAQVARIGRHGAAAERASDHFAALRQLDDLVQAADRDQQQRAGADHGEDIRNPQAAALRIAGLPVRTTLRPRPDRPPR